ncbi:MAG: archaemetzincin family Zn-dependent metalloprotease, partial [Bacteroidales bacterium]|nr:archaemetzincin family Zn-dependent metalloprotease [Bacteroidales bacterium]
SFLKDIGAAVGTELTLPVRIREGFIDLSEFYDPPRRQYNATKLLKEVDIAYGAESARTMGLFSVDLFIPILTYIFGQAILEGRTGVASHYRLNNERYGLPPDQGLLVSRFSREVIHELGHTFGLLHCHSPLCVMRSSTYVEDIDQKEASFCGSCSEKLASYIQTNIKPD